MDVEDRSKVVAAIERILVLRRAGQVSVRQTCETLAMVITGAAEGDEALVREWLDPERVSRWRDDCHEPTRAGGAETEAVVTITPAQCRAARKTLKWSRDRLAPRAGISTVKLAGFENETAVLTNEELGGILGALLEAGVGLSSLRSETLKRSDSA